jgi:hypothetical protein
MREGDGKAVQKRSGAGAMVDVLMTPARSLAVLTDVAPPDRETRTYRVLKIEQNRKIQLDQGTEIDPRSLAVSRHLVYWTRGGQARSAHIE